VLVFLLVALALLVALGVALQRRDPRAESDDGPVLRYSTALRRLANAAPVAVLAAAGAAWLPRSGGTPDGSAFLLTLFALVFLDVWLLRIELLATRVRLRQDGVEASSAWRRAPVVLRWADLATIRWSPMGQGFVLVGRGGERVRVSRFLSGLGDLARAVRVQVPLDDATAGPGVRPRLAAYAGELRGARGS
jgi:hypothetical protein